MKRLIQAYRRWKCRRDYNRLSPVFRKIVDCVDDDPDRLIMRGDL